MSLMSAQISHFGFKALSWEDIVAWMKSMDIDETPISIIEKEKVPGSQLLAMSLEDLMEDLQMSKLQAKRVVMWLESGLGTGSFDSLHKTARKGGTTMADSNDSDWEVLLSEDLSGKWDIYDNTAERAEEASYDEKIELANEENQLQHHEMGEVAELEPATVENTAQATEKTEERQMEVESRVEGPEKDGQKTSESQPPQDSPSQPAETGEMSEQHQGAPLAESEEQDSQPVGTAPQAQAAATSEAPGSQGQPVEVEEKPVHDQGASPESQEPPTHMEPELAPEHREAAHIESEAQVLQDQSAAVSESQGADIHSTGSVPDQGTATSDSQGLDAGLKEATGQKPAAVTESQEAVPQGDTATEVPQAEPTPNSESSTIESAPAQGTTAGASAVAVAEAT